VNRILSLLCPSRYVRSVCDISPVELREQGVSAILIDLDNTLVAWRGYEILPEIKDWLDSVRKNQLKVCIVSNTRYARRLQQLAEELGVPFVNGTMKPRRGGFLEAIRLLGCGLNDVVVVGDQIFTDILGGNRLGLCTILVKPLSRREFVGTKISRIAERLLLWLLKKWGLLRCEVANDPPAAGTLP